MRLANDPLGLVHRYTQTNSSQDEESSCGLQYNTGIQPIDWAIYLGNDGEGRLPLLFGNDVNNEVLTFHTLYPEGKFGFDVQRFNP